MQKKKKKGDNSVPSFGKTRTYIYKYDHTFKWTQIIKEKDVLDYIYMCVCVCSLVLSPSKTDRIINISNVSITIFAWNCNICALY